MDQTKTNLLCYRGISLFAGAGTDLASLFWQWEAHSFFLDFIWQSFCKQGFCCPKRLVPCNPAPPMPSSIFHPISVPSAKISSSRGTLFKSSHSAIMSSQLHDPDKLVTLQKLLTWQEPTANRSTWWSEEEASALDFCLWLSSSSSSSSSTTSSICWMHVLQNKTCPNTRSTSEEFACPVTYMNRFACRRSTNTQSCAVPIHSSCSLGWVF